MGDPVNVICVVTAKLQEKWSLCSAWYLDYVCIWLFTQEQRKRKITSLTMRLVKKAFVDNQFSRLVKS